ncbi:MAG: hypothetical protein ABL878_06030 [Burkholderiales bacterium]
MEGKKIAGLAVAAAAAMLFASGCASTGGGMGSTAKMKCAGANACKGQGECKAASNGCKGQNACGRQGWVFMESKADCTAAGGTAS